MYTLITAATSAQAHRLKNSLTTEWVILGDYLELPAFMLKDADMMKLPNPASLSYAHEMLTLCIDRNINKIYALKTDELVLLNESRQLFAEFGIEIIGGS
jgi:hypothetical protein